MLISLVIIGLILIIIVFLYNKLIERKNQVENAFGSVDVMLKKRYDLIPNLVESVKAYMTHEKDTLQSLTELRTKALTNKQNSEQKVKLNNELTSQLDKIQIAVENYPELKAGENFIQVQKAWNEAEDNISASRRFYNTAVTDYNNIIEQFPTNLLAKALKYDKKLVFKISEVESENLNAKDLFAK